MPPRRLAAVINNGPFAILATEQRCRERVSGKEGDGCLGWKSFPGLTSECISDRFEAGE